MAHVCAMLKRNIIGSKIQFVKVANDNLVFPYLKQYPDATKHIQQSLEGLIVEKVGRHGKYFWIRFDKNLIMLMHFGMTGTINLKGVKSHMVFMERDDKQILEELERKSKYFKAAENIKEEEIVNEIWPPKFSKLEITFNDHQFSFNDARRLARIRLLNDIKNDQDLFRIEPLNRQGPDYSKNEINDADNSCYVIPLTLNEFQKLLQSRNKPIKSFLLDQQYFAGIGNWVADEICYKAKIHPKSNFYKYQAEHENIVNRLFESIIEITQMAVISEGDVRKFPDSWLMPYRWGKKRKKQKSPKVGGNPIDFITIGGRTSCFVPQVQQLIQPKVKKS